MSLIGAFGSHREDLNGILLRSQELLKLASAPLMIYRVKSKDNQPSTDNLYGEVTQKEYDRPLELIGFFQNPTLIQELVKLGIDMPESITIYFDILQMNEVLGGNLQIGDIIRPYHQRKQFYIVQNSLPNPATEKLFKYTQWYVVAEKTHLSGRNIPEYLTFDGLTTWITFGEHWGTEFLSDRERLLDDRSYQIFGDLKAFWSASDFYGLKNELGSFDGETNYVSFGNNYNFGSNAFTMSVFLKPKQLDVEQCLFRKGDDFYIKILEDNTIEVKIGNQIFNTTDTSTPFFENTDDWVQFSLNVYPPDNYIGIYKNATEQAISPTTISAYDINNASNFLVGTCGEIEPDHMEYDACDCYGESGGTESGNTPNLYKGYMSNLRIYNVSLTDAELLNDYQSIITRQFISVD